MSLYDLSVWVVPCVMWVGGAGRVGNVDAVRSWVASGADINVVDERGRRLCGCWLRRGVTLRCVTTAAARLSSTHGAPVVTSGVVWLRGGLRRRWHERRRGWRRVR